MKEKQPKLFSLILPTEESVLRRVGLSDVIIDLGLFSGTSAVHGHVESAGA
jgi:hypothetical protein